MGAIYLSYWMFLALLAILFGVSYLHYERKKWYFVVAWVVLFIIQFYYLTDLFYSHFIWWSWNFTGFVYAIMLLIISIIYIILSFVKDSKILLHYTIVICVTHIVYTLPLLSGQLNNKRISNFNSFILYVIDNSNTITDEDKKRLLQPPQNSQRGWKISQSDFKEAKRIAWLFDFRYCKEIQSDECYLEFIKGQEGLEWYKNVAEKREIFLKKYGNDINDNIILEWLQMDIVEEVRKGIEIQLKKILIEIWIQPSEKIPISSNTEERIIDNRISVRMWGHKYFAVKNKKTVEEKREFIKNLLKNLKKIHFNDLIYTEDLNTKPSRKNWIETITMTQSKIYVVFNKHLEFSIKISQGNALYVNYSIDYEQYLSDEKDKDDFLKNFKIIFSYFAQDRIWPYISELEFYNMWPDMKYNYDLNAKYSWNMINSNISEEVLTEKKDNYIK